jgi:hypothetical protein
MPESVWYAWLHPLGVWGLLVLSVESVGWLLARLMVGGTSETPSPPRSDGA